MYVYVCLYVPSAQREVGQGVYRAASEPQASALRVLTTRVLQCTLPFLLGCRSLQVAFPHIPEGRYTVVSSHSQS